ncbi:MAG: hypothetical protein GY816_19420, partial [Cytophagales bacterium]|nr:hypothetical protein [Cytophagales bacterium]
MSTTIKHSHNNYIQLILSRVVEAKCEGFTLYELERDYLHITEVLARMPIMVFNYEKHHHPDNAPHPDVPILNGAPLAVQMQMERNWLEVKKVARAEVEADHA